MKEMEYITLESRQIPVVAETDVFVAGGGSAGVGAAISAARSGAKVLLVERMFCLGGMMTAGLMSKIAISPHNLGLATEILERLDAIQGTHYLESRPEVPIDPENAKLLLDQMVIEECGVDVRFGTMVTGVVKKDREIKAVLISNIEGEQAVKAKFFIDCTGDGQMAFLAGAQCMMEGGEEYASSPTLMFRIGNCNLERLFDYMDENPELFKLAYNTYNHHVMSVSDYRENLKNQIYIHVADFVALIRLRCDENPDMFTAEEREILLRRGLLFMNQPNQNHVLVNSTTHPNWRGDSAEELSCTVPELRRHCHILHRFVKAFIPGFEDSFLMDTASILGIRESRRIKGDYVLTQEDVESLRHFDDAICSNNGGVEIHKGTKGNLVLRELPIHSRYDVPYRAVISCDFDNLYMAGRCFSATHPALSAARNIAYCCALGEACGTAAALLVKEGKRNVRDVDLKELQKKVSSNLGVNNEI